MKIVMGDPVALFGVPRVPSVAPPPPVLVAALDVGLVVALVLVLVLVVGVLAVVPAPVEVDPPLPLLLQPARTRGTASAVPSTVSRVRLRRISAAIALSRLSDSSVEYVMEKLTDASVRNKVSVNLGRNPSASVPDRHQAGG